MRILIVAPHVPYPATDGGRIVVYNTARALHVAGHEIGMACISPAGQAIPRELTDIFRVWSEEANTHMSYAGALRGIVSSQPYVIRKFHSRGFREQVRAAAEALRPDVVHVEFLAMAVFGLDISERYGVPGVLRLHNVDSTLMRRYRDTRRSPLTRLYAGIEVPRLVAYERAMLKRFSRRVAITTEDARVFSQTAGVSVDSIPAGVDADYWNPVPMREEDDALLYLASFDWLPNVDSAVWFIESILPRIRANAASAKLYLVGRNPPEALRRFHEGGAVIISGTVGDVRPWVDGCSVAVVPTRVGSGLRIKILELLAMQKAVVSTRVGCEGITGLVDGQNILLADDEQGFADATLRLLRDRQLRQRLGKAGRRLVTEHYTWGAVARQFGSVYESVLSGRYRSTNPSTAAIASSPTADRG